MAEDCVSCFFFQAEDGIRDLTVTGVQTCALPISFHRAARGAMERRTGPRHRDRRRRRSDRSHLPGIPGTWPDLAASGAELRDARSLRRACGWRARARAMAG